MRGILLCMSALMSSVLAMATTATYVNNSNGAISPDMVIGDTYTVTVTGAPNSPVTSDSAGGHFSLGTTNTSGIWSHTGSAMDPGDWTITYSVGGVAAPQNEFEIIEAPKTLSYVSGSVTTPNSGCDATYLGAFGDLKYQIRGTSGASIETAILLLPYEDILFPNGSQRGSDIGPVPGYPTSTKYAAVDGTFHDVPVGACFPATVFPFSNVPFGRQTISIYAGNNVYQVRVNNWVVSSPGVNHGSVTNNNDITISR